MTSLFEPIGSDLKSVLLDIIERSEEQNKVIINWIDNESELVELVRLRLTKEVYWGGDGPVALTYAGSNYFSRKEAWTLERCKDIVGDITKEDKAELSKLVVIAAENPGKPIMSGFNTESDSENASIARLAQRGYIDVKYTDNVPWFINITPKGFDYLYQLVRS